MRASTRGPMRVYGTHHYPAGVDGHECMAMELDCTNESVNDPNKASSMAKHYFFAPGILGQALGLYHKTLHKSEQFNGALQVLGDPDWPVFTKEQANSPFTTLGVLIPLRRIPEAPSSPTRTALPGPAFA
jgi:hypothetical protein